MEVKLEVLLSSSIKRRKPWPRFCWLGREKEGVFLLDDNRISEVYLLSGRTKKKIPKLQPLLQRVVTMSASQNGVWLVGLLVSGELFLWNKDKDVLKTVSAVPSVHQLVSSIKGSATTLGLSLLVSENAQRVFLAALTGQVFLWECVAPQDLSGPRDATVTGRWSHISYNENTQLPSTKDKEASVHSVFVKNQAVGDACLSAFVFTAEEKLTVTLLKIQWDSTWENKLRSVGFSVRWASKCFPLSQLLPPCNPVKSRGALVPAFSPDAQLLAVVLNQKDPRATQVLFISTQNFVTVSSLLGGCGIKTLNIPAKYVRSYWVCSVSWTADGLYLACVLKRGSLLMLARLGGLVSLSTTGCSVEFGAAHFLPLHPLVTYRAPVPLQPPEAGLSSSSLSLRDPMRQRFSVTWHPRQPLLIVSDGYMATVLRMAKSPSAAEIMSSLLLEAAQGLENIRQLMASSQPQLMSRLESMSTLTFTGSLLAPKEKETPLSTLPLYLQGTGDLTQCTERAQDEEDHDSDEDPYACSHMEDGGKLEFASMFDTLHAQAQTDPEPTPAGLQEDLNRVHRNLLRAWALAVSLGGSMEQRERLLRFTILCLVRLLTLLRVSDSTGRKSKSTWLTHTLHTLRTLLSFLPWDATHSAGSCCLGVTVELTRCFVDMFVPLSSSDVALSSQNFNTAIFVLQQASQSVDRAYSLPSRAVHHGEDGQRTYTSDMFSVPILQEDIETVAQPARQQPSHRLVVIWRELYRLALRYQEQLCHQRGQGVVKNESEKMSAIIAQVQQALQSAGDRLEESHTLRSFSGEQHFILGEYAESLQVWRAELWAERERAGPMTCYLEIRYCLALLYSQLFLYRLREAQGLCDRLAHQLLKEEDTPGGADEAVFECWLSGPVGREAACAVVQSLGRFMAAYFTNRPLCILPPHNVDVLPPLHLTHNAGVRVVELAQARVAGAVRGEHLSEVWTVDYALELLLLGGLLPEAVWMAERLGDWKMAATLGLAYTNYCRGHVDLSSLQWRELHLPIELKPAVLFQDQLEKLLGRVAGSEGEGSKDTVVVEDVDLLQVSVQEILKASVMAEVDVVSQPLTRLLNAAKERATSLPALVPPAFYLPAPPLYCPQPSPNTQDCMRDAALVLETDSRCQVSGLVRKVLMIFRAAHSSLPAARWYISNLQRCRHLLHKIQKKVSEPKAELIPDGLKKFFTHRGFFQSGPSKDMDSVTTQIITCFRELCALCWMLHVRDQLTVSCRRYQTAREREKDTQARDVSVSDLCAEALCWARRLLPFCRFLNAEEALQDLVLSLVSELPPSHVTAETLARVFPEESESVRVPLREKFTSLVQRLRPVMVPDSSTPATLEDEGGDTMMILIQDQLRQRRRELRRLEKYLGAPEQFLWEREEEEDRGGAASILKRLSLGTSLSDSTLTDGGRPLVYSEGDTAETLSEPLSPELQPKSAHSSKTAKFHDAPAKSNPERKGNRSGSVEPKEPESSHMGSSVPTVGTWEFELEDEEYMLFLDLFLSYVLGKDRLEESELPLLSSFSQRLHTRELHSATFDLLTTLKRRQKDGRKPDARLPLFRAGHCFQTLPVIPEPPPSIGPVQSNTRATSDWTLPGLHGKHQGLFGLRQMSKGNWTGSDVQSRAFKILSPAEVCVQMQLDSSLEKRFPQLARLLEWMMRWADRRVLLSQPIGKTSEGSGSVVIRVKGSTPAVLSALELLEQRYSAALLGENTNHAHYTQLHQREGPDAPVPQPITGWRRDRGYPGSAGSPITAPELDVCEGEDAVEQTDDQLTEHEDTMISDEQNHLTAEDDESSAADVTEASWANQSRAHRDQTLTMADLQCPDTDEHSLQSQSCSEENPVSCRTHRPEVSASVSVQQASGPTPTVTSRRSARHSSGHPSPSGAQTQTDPVTQLLQDELFKLVQLQQINFMSLMQVVGASFANLPLSQANMRPSNVNLPQTPAIPAQQQAQPISLTQNAQQHTVCDDTDLPTRASRPERANNSQDDHEHPVNVNLNPHHEMEQRNPPLKTQDIQQLTIRSDWPEDGQSHGRSFIPTSQGLLTTANNPPALHASGYTGHPRAAPITHGLRLLQLPPAQRSPPPVKDAWGPDLTSFLPSQCEPSSVRRVEDRGRTRAGASVAPPSHVPSSRSNTQEPLRLPPAPHRPAPAAALPLLRFHPDSQRPATLPHIPQSIMAKPSLGVTATGHYPRIQLLRREPDPPAADLRFSAPPVRTPRLIPLEELMRWTGTETKLQLLKTDTVPENKRPSSRRRKRREEKNKEDRIGVTFRLEESIIPPDEPAEDVPDQNDAYSIPLGSCDSELSGRLLLDQVYSTSAELHVFASTQKTAPEIQDAWTSTDTEPPRSITDKHGSVQPQSSPSMPSAPEGGRPDVAPVVPPDVAPVVPPDVAPVVPPDVAPVVPPDVAPVVPPDVFLNLRFSKDRSSDQPETRSRAEPNADLSPEGRRFINVMDLTDDSLLQSLPPSPPSSAPLHLLAASVVNPAPKPALSSAPIHTEHLIGEIPGPSVVCISPEAVLGADPVTLSVLRAVRTPGLDRVLMSRSQISARLSEMDTQLLRLQSIADHMDREFANTRLLVNTIETLSPGEQKKPLRVTQEVRSSCPSPHRFGRMAGPEREEEEEVLSSSVLSRSSVHHDRSPPAVKPEQCERDTNPGLLEGLSESLPWIPAEETLGVSGLSDVKDILCELIRDGALSRSVLDLCPSGTLDLSRSEVTPSGAMMEEERRDLRMWMRRKQRERLTEYRKQREEKRESERRPFISPLTHNLTSVDLASNKKSKEERDRMVLQEHHEQRARDACSLITDLLTTPLTLPTIPQQTLRSAPSVSRSQSSGKNQRTPKNPSGPHRCSASSLGKTVVLQRKSAAKAHGSLSGRLGLHRPASDLPGDRLSQVTRRGMLSDPRTTQRTKTVHQRMKNGVHTSTAKPRAEKEKDQAHVEDRDAVSPDDVHRFLLLEDHDIRQRDEAFTAVDPLRDLDLDFSQSTGSVLSKLDWAAIERIVAEEDDEQQ